jgi:pyrroline-5-carboxylate reductase
VLVGQTLLGSATLLATGDRSAEQLRADVTSPGGTTAAGLHALERAGVRAAFLDAVAAATRRSRELGG